MNIALLFTIGFVIGAVIGLVLVRVIQNFKEKEDRMTIQAKLFQDAIKQQMQNGCYKVVSLSELESWDDPE